MNFKDTLLNHPKLKILIEFIAQDKTKSFVVGGWVRDLILGVESDDIDIVVEGNGIAFAKRFSKFIGMKSESVVVFERFGTAKIKSQEWDLDFVGARKESYNSASRNPEVQIGTIMDDLSRRDLTINAMSICLNQDTLGDLNDPFNGLDDLRRGLIRTPINPIDTFKDDPLRMLRCIRFASRFRFTIEQPTMDAIKSNVSRLSIISAERINVELEKTLLTNDPKYGFELLDESGLLNYVLPEMVKLKGVQTINGVSHKDNFIHTLGVLNNVSVVSNDIILRWVAVLHDIGKPKSKTFEDNTWQFHNHEAISEYMINKIAERLKWSTEQTVRVKKLTKFHGLPKELVKKGVSDSAIRRFVLDTEDIFDDLITFCKCDITTTLEKRRLNQITALINLETRVVELREKDNLRNWKNPVTGDWLMEVTGLSPGRIIGEVLAATKEAIMEGEISNEQSQAQEFALEWLRTHKATKV